MSSSPTHYLIHQLRQLINKIASPVRGEITRHSDPATAGEESPSWDPSPAAQDDGGKRSG